VEEHGCKPEHSVVHHTWLTLAGRSEYDYLFINIDPASEDFGTIRWCVNNCGDEGDYCADLETLLEQVARYVERRERARAKYAVEEPEADDDMLEDYVIDQVELGEDSDEEQDEQHEREEDASDNDDQEEMDE
jgi:hypothetical protein